MNHKDCPYKRVWVKVDGNIRHKFTECLEHKVIFCHCGCEFGEHPVSDGILKNRCVVCWKPIIMTRQRYIANGNYCPSCSMDCERIRNGLDKEPVVQGWKDKRDKYYSQHDHITDFIIKVPIGDFTNDDFKRTDAI